jgi:hypothetical protein
MSPNPLLSPRVRARLATLGELSRPLGEERASALARSIAMSLVTEVSRGRDPERALDRWLTQIACEIAVKAQAGTAPADSPPRARPVKDLLPEIG